MISARAEGLGLACILAAALVGCCALGGCVETEDSLQTASISSSTQMPMRPGVSPGGATIAFASIEGPPPQMATAFADQLVTAAASRAVVTKDPQSANYLVRGYLTAYPVDEGTAITAVWDVFDSQKRRTRRIDDTVTVQGSAEDPWSVANKAVMASIAGKSADDLAAFLSNTPEAVAAAAQPATAVVAASPSLDAQPPIADAPPDTLSYR